MKFQWTQRSRPSLQLRPSILHDSEMGEAPGSPGPVLAIWWLFSLMAGVFHAGSRTAGSRCFKFPLGQDRTLNKQTHLLCDDVRIIGPNPGTANMIWGQRTGPDSHLLSIKGRLCPLQMGLGTGQAVLLLFTGLLVEENNH